jgi:predicted nuclease with RNAse H fold
VIAAGIDLSGRTTGTTALAWVEGDPPRVTGIEDRGLRDDAELVRRCLDRAPAVVAIDAPLSLPHAVTCADPECPRCFAPGARSGSRAVDGKEAWAAAGHTEKPPMPMAMLAAIAFRAIHLRRLLAGVEVIETWPMGTYRALARGEPPGDTGDAWRRRLLAACGLHVTGGTDRLDAVAAAYAGWCRLHDRATVVRADGDEIWVATRPVASGTPRRRSARSGSRPDR